MVASVTRASDPNTPQPEPEREPTTQKSEPAECIDYINCELHHTLSGHNAGVCSVSISPDGRTLASGSKDKTIKLWDIDTGELRHTLSGHSHWVNSVSISPDGRTLASGSEDNTIKLWRVTAPT